MSKQKIDWAAVIEELPQELINALAGRIADVLRRETPEIQDITLISTADGSSRTEAKTKKFIKPSLAEIYAYCAERGNSVNAESFYNFYEAKAWYVGKNPMKDWKACVITWEQRDGAKSAPKTAEQNRAELRSKHASDIDRIIAEERAKQERNGGNSYDVT